MPLRPLLDRVLVKPREEEEVSEGGILLAGTAKGDTLKGDVVAVGQGYRNTDGSTTPLTLREGDTVLYNKASASEVKVDGNTLVLLTETGVLGILD